MATTMGRRKPAITITRTEHEKLVRLAEIRAAKGSETADELLAELDRARIVDDRRIASGVVRMGSAVSYRTDAGESRTVTLVFPGEADIAEGKISVLTPIGAALIGLSASQSIDWTSRDGRVHRLTVEHVGQNDIARPPLPQTELRTA